MSDPYEVLGLPGDADDETIRRRYLELVRQFTPERRRKNSPLSARRTKPCAT